MINRTALRRISAETLRDIGILVFVFGPLDAVYEPGPLNSGLIAFWLALGLSFMTLGIIMEVWE